jgi:ribosome-associated protein
VIVIKAQRYRNQESNRKEALIRLQRFIKSAAVIYRKRKPTKPTQGSQKRRLDRKNKRGKVKSLRGKVTLEELKIE